MRTWIQDNKQRQISREELYDLVWEKPMTAVGKMLGISDVAVRKVCVKHNIPRPPQGYWASSNPHRHSRPKLAQPGPAGSTITISAPSGPATKSPVVPVDVPSAVAKAIEAGVPKRVSNRLLATSKALKSGSPDKYGFLRPGLNSAVHEVIATKYSLSRALFLMEYIFRICEAGKITIVEPKLSRQRYTVQTYLEKDGGRVSLRVKSEIKQIINPPDPKALYQPRYSYQDTGRLVVTVSERSIKESDEQQLELKIENIYHSIIKSLDASREQNLRWERRQREHKIERRRAAIEQTISHANQMRLENFHEFKDKVSKISEYAKFFELILAEKGLSGIPGFEEWLSWVKPRVVSPISECAHEAVARDKGLTERLSELGRLDPEDDTIEWSQLGSMM